MSLENQTYKEALELTLSLLNASEFIIGDLYAYFVLRSEYSELSFAVTYYGICGVIDVLQESNKISTSNYRAIMRKINRDTAMKHVISPEAAKGLYMFKNDENSLNNRVKYLENLIKEAA